MKHLSTRAPLDLRAYFTSAANSTSSVRSSAPACSPSTTRTSVTQLSSAMTRRSALTLLGVSSAATIASLAACGPRDSATSAGTAQNPNSSVPLVLTTFTVIQDMASRVAGEFCQVESITKAGAEIHDYEPTPDDLKRAQKAQLILNNGLGLERWFERFVDDSPAQRADLSEGITAIPIAEGDYQGQANPHAWMSPANGKIYVENIVRALSNLVPDHAKDLCRDTNMKELYLWAVNAADEGTPQQIAKVVETVKAQQIPAVFCESTVSPKAMQQVADETGAVLRTDEKNILYVDSLSEADGPVPTYLDLLQHDADAIVSGLMGR